MHWPRATDKAGSMATSAQKCPSQPKQLSLPPKSHPTARVPAAGFRRRVAPDCTVMNVCRRCPWHQHHQHVAIARCRQWVVCIRAVKAARDHLRLVHMRDGGMLQAAIANDRNVGRRRRQWSSTSMSAATRRLYAPPDQTTPRPRPSYPDAAGPYLTSLCWDLGLVLHTTTTTLDHAHPAAQAHRPRAHALTCLDAQLSRDGRSLRPMS